MKTQHLVRLVAPFKDGNLSAAMVEAGFLQYQNVPGYFIKDQTAWVDECLYSQMANSGAEMEVQDTRMSAPPPSGPTSEVMDEKEIEFLTLDDLNLTGPAKDFADKNGVLPIELLDTLGEWEQMSGAWKDHKFSLSDVKAILEG